MIRAVFLACAMLASDAAAESVQDALTGRWAIMRGSQAATDAENLAAASAVCALEGADQGVIHLAFANGRFALTTTDKAGVEKIWRYDPQISGGRLGDGRLALNFSVTGQRTHEMIFWRATLDGVEHNLLEVQGPPNPAGLYLKCPG
ncbi:MAG: hypothetical protein AAGH74_13100 [Pseudomonadota bacterium]